MRDLLGEGKRFWGIVAAILVPIGWISGLIVNFPKVIEGVVSNGPNWVQTPDVLWFVAFAVIETAIITWVWRQPVKPSHPEPEKDEFFEQMQSLMKVGSPRECRLLTFLCEVHLLQRGIAEWPSSKENNSYAVNILRIVFPSRMSELLEEGVRRKYMRELESARKSNDLYIVAQTVIPLLADAIIDALLQEGDNRMAAVMAKMQQKEVALIEN